MKAIYIDPNGVVKYNAEWPEGSDFAENFQDGSGCGKYDDAGYQSALSKAKQESVPFADQDYIKKSS